MDEPNPGDTPPEQAEDLSVAEHEAQFSAEARVETPAPEADSQPTRERDEAGKFAKPEAKPEKHRAKSQEASARDVPRIAELTRRLRETEAERDALRVAPRSLRPQTAEPAAVAAPSVPRETPPAAATDKPKIDNFQEYGDYVEALADWKIAEARRQDRETAQKETAQREFETNWRTKVDGAKERYPDFEQVALIAPTAIPQGGLIDAWIREHRAGADVLYSLQKDPGELRRILALPLFDQVEALTLLSQRSTGQAPRAAAVRTGAAPTTPVKVAPRPPTPVRTSAVPAPDEPPGDDASIAEHEAFYHRPRRY